MMYIYLVYWVVCVVAGVVVAVVVLAMVVAVDGEATCVASVANTGCPSAGCPEETLGIPVVTFLSGFPAS